METTATQSQHRARLWLGASLTGLILVLVAYVALQGSGRSTKTLMVLGQVNGFSLTNQFGQPVTLTNLLGRVWVADVIFSRCRSSCEILTRRMAALQPGLPSADKVQLVSLTADPEFDSPDVLRKYAEARGADPARWIFLTGPKKEIYRFAVEELKFVVLDKTQEQRDPLEEMFLHSTLLVIVDRQGRIRSYVQGAEPAAQEQVLRIVRQLLKEK